MRTRWVILAPAALAAMALFVFLGGELVKLLWNWLLPPLFGWRELTFWQALGLLALCRILFGGLGMRSGPSGRSSFRQRISDRMADRVAARWEQMTAEERERFRQRLRERMGFDPTAGGPDAARPAGETQ